jgi:hypothetical protein
MSRTYKAKYESMLPATPCSPELRKQIEQAAKQRGVSIAEIQREAFTFFLSGNYSQTIVSNSQTIQECQPA